MPSGTDAGRFAATSMSMGIGPVLDTIGGLRSGVARSCHVGNNTANNWAWLALAPNTQMIQFDHTLYGMDEVAAPWVLLRDRGVVQACFDHRGRPQPQYAGLHVNSVIPRVERCYLSHLNYGVFACHEERDLISSYCDISARLCAQINGTGLTFDSTELLSMRPLFCEIATGYARMGLLDRLFDRWVRTARRGNIIVEPLHEIAADSAGGRIRFTGMNGEILFDGGIDELLAQFFEALALIPKRLLTGSRIAKISYPWLTLAFTYLARAIKEYEVDPGQRTFWHGGGSASSYYINGAALQLQFGEHQRALTALGVLPDGVLLRFIPTYCAQLCALDGEGATILAKLLEIWLDFCRRQGTAMTELIACLENTVDPADIVASAMGSIGAARIREIRLCMAAFNERTAHRLPIAHTPVRPIHRTYNKYGIAQANLLGRRFVFPDQLRELRWGEAELLVKVLAMIVREERE
jgi:hypothetical protein